MPSSYINKKQPFIFPIYKKKSLEKFNFRSFTNSLKGLTCNDGSENHGDAHGVFVTEHVPIVVVDHNGPPSEVENQRRKEKCHHFALGGAQRKLLV